uniref:D-xylose 1-dehydrogenase (NADP(+), D-xylono-1,5-lactone-forming) n=1 Tax=Odontella aurita TaxID=265563 RepID=A0A7S4HUZ5_9STRA|mmetsp:Transcript_15636/g.45119  ORF Transcript_15636/g.45119 Transcript_15636/m.45119 type:complete len:364 (+) Transcript_15636:39-1130(+)|eukprot:CAMPEP_0113548856 /NCGR_PEP_ID=MMETSP0015_2-20120614/13116_1 /TAXON_ID=2838 /ORGANISM="Odontella" /LENGTH=363 /DNA_ID=CAMNT_0000449513 /DNA_START=39 /DNA_END=1130 /DNA_ORIENTATION=+ /assembly_acc=CAM_ASM_000160
MAGGEEPRTVRWGVLGTGSVATDMVQILKQLPGTEVIAVGSRSDAGAARFADRWDVPNRHGSYESLCTDPDVDVVYVATPSLRHPQDCLLALKNGKAVLCEKSMAPNPAVAREILDEAKSRNLLFVHAVWSRFFPAMNRVRELIRDGTIGEVKSARASFCQNDGAGSCSALLETGIYCAQFLQWVLSDPNGGDDGGKEKPVVRGASRTEHGDTGLDCHVSALVEFPGSKFGTFECSLAHCSERSAAVYGTEGTIELSFPFWCPTEIKVTKMSGQGSQKWDGPETMTFPLPEGVKALPVSKPGEGESEGHVPGFHFVNSQGFTYEASEFNRCFREGLTETPQFSSAQCLEILEIIADIDAVSRK